MEVSRLLRGRQGWPANNPSSIGRRRVNINASSISEGIQFHTIKVREWGCTKVIAATVPVESPPGRMCTRRAFLFFTTIRLIYYKKNSDRNLNSTYLRMSRVLLGSFNWRPSHLCQKGCTQSNGFVYNTLLTFQTFFEFNKTLHESQFTHVHAIANDYIYTEASSSTALWRSFDNLTFFCPIPPANLPQ